jgi:hypothetical protein
MRVVESCGGGGVIVRIYRCCQSLASYIPYQSFFFFFSLVRRQGQFSQILPFGLITLSFLSLSCLWGIQFVHLANGVLGNGHSCGRRVWHQHLEEMEYINKILTKKNQILRVCVVECLMHNLLES